MFNTVATSLVTLAVVVAVMVVIAAMAITRHSRRQRLAIVRALWERPHDERPFFTRGADLKRRTGTDDALYPLLRILEDEGIVESREGVFGTYQEHGEVDRLYSRKCRFYNLTRLGVAFAKAHEEPRQ